MSDRIAEIEKRILLKKEKIISTLKPNQPNVESTSVNSLGLTTEEKISLTIEMLNLSKSPSQFDRDKSSAIKYFLSADRAKYTEIFEAEPLSKNEILNLSEIDAKKKEILRSEGIGFDNDLFRYPFPELFPEESTSEELKVAKLYRSVIAEEFIKRGTSEHGRTEDIINRRIINESKKPVKCFKTMSELYILKNIWTKEQKKCEQEMADLISELYD